MSVPERISALPDSHPPENLESWKVGRWYRKATGPYIVEFVRVDVADEWKRQRDALAELANELLPLAEDGLDDGSGYLSSTDLRRLESYRDHLKTLTEDTP